MRKLTKGRIYVDNPSPRYGVGAIVVGDEFGPVLLFVGHSVETAIDEWDERHGQRVDPEDAALADYPGGIEGALESGDARVNDGGTVVWVNHYEWVREFRTVREAGRFWRGD